MSTKNSSDSLNICVIGSGISGMAAAWLLSQQHQVTLYEKDDRVGGHTNTVALEGPRGNIQVDTGFIVYNELNYPNLVALFNHLGVATQETDMSFAASLEKGRFEYSGSGLGGLLAQRRNILRPRMWQMVRDILRFYREAPDDAADPAAIEMTLGEYLARNNYSSAFIRDHLLPMGAAIWSTPTRDMLAYPLVTFIRFCANHGLLQLKDRPLWRTVRGGSKEYVKHLIAPFSHNILLNTGVSAIHRSSNGVRVEDRQGGQRRFDHVVLATHADQSLAMLADADAAEKRLLGCFRYESNLAVLHTDERLMPRNKRAWASWNFLGQHRGDEQKVSVTYWMNRLQGLPPDPPLFVSLNPVTPPREGTILRSFLYDHPLFDKAAVQSQRLLWNLQGTRRTWFCGAYFGQGFHEDGLQAGLAVAEQLGGLQRPWELTDQNNRIHCYPTSPSSIPREAAA